MASLLCVGGEAAGQYAEVPNGQLKHDASVRVIVHEPMGPVFLLKDNISPAYKVSHSCEYRVTKFVAPQGPLFFLRPSEMSDWHALEALLISYRKNHT